MRVLLLLFLILFTQISDSFAADADHIPIPESAEVEQKGDLSLGVITRLFGNTADVLIGGSHANIDDADGFFSGLIVSVLGVLNFAAMVYLSAMVAYMWGVFSITTAHRGEQLGGGVYNSFWIPVRHAASFALTVPVIKGLSLMQVFMIFTIGLSINFANAVWNFASDHLINDVKFSVQNVAYSDSFAQAQKFAPMMFKNCVVQVILADKAVADGKAIWEKEYTSFDPENKSGLAVQEYPIDWDGNVDAQGPLLRIDDYANGRIIIRQRDLAYVRFSWWAKLWDGAKEHNPGLIQIVMPKWTKTHTDEVFYSEPPFMIDESELYKPGSEDDIQTLRKYFVFTGNTDSPDYKIRMKFAENKVKRILALWKQMAIASDVYVQSYASAGDSCSIAPCKYDADEAKKTLGQALEDGFHQYAKGVQDDTVAASEEFMKQTGLDDQKQIRELMRKAVDKEMGWMGAGLLPFATASLQHRILQVTSAGTATYNGSISDSKLKLEEDGVGEDQPLNRNYFNGIVNAPDFFVMAMQESTPSYTSVYLAKTENEDKFLNFADIQDSIINMFDGDSGTKESFGGVLGWVLTKIKTQEPMLVLQSFGQRLFDAATVGTIVSAVLDKFTGYFVQITFVLLTLVFVGAFFAYVVPFIPVIYWIKALISWVFMVIEAMVAAPFWVCAHAMPEGKGFAGNHARRGWMMLLDIVVRPVLLVTGVICAIVLAQVAGRLVHSLFNIWFVNVVRFENMSFVSDVIYAILVMSVIYTVFYVVYTTGISYMPEHVLQWCGGVQGGGLRDEDEGTREILEAGGAQQMQKNALSSMKRDAMEESKYTRDAFEHKLKSLKF